LSNIYLHAFDRIVTNPKSEFAKAGIRIVRYADDFVLMGTYYYSKKILSYIDSLMGRMGLTLNKEKPPGCILIKRVYAFLVLNFG
jgi:RNA-directed DNA polymerase